MKKLFLFFSLALTLLFTGCGNDQKYITALKSVVVEEVLNSKTTEELAANAIGLAMDQKVEMNQLKWKVDGETKEGKMVVAEYNNYKMYFPTVKNGDYVEYTLDKVYIITASNNKVTFGELMYTDIVNGFANIFEGK